MIIDGFLIAAPIYEIVKRLQVETGLLQNVTETTDSVMVSCPSHKGGMESNPSCGILVKNKEVTQGSESYTIPKGSAHCFTCGLKVQFPEFVSLCFGKMDGGMYGTQWLLENYIAAQVENRNLELNIGRGQKKKKEYPVPTEEELDSYRYYHKYMYERGLTDELIEFFDIGYDQATTSITFPVNDVEGNTLFIQRRSVLNKFFHIDEVPKSRTIYGVDKIVDNVDNLEYMWITESTFDAINIWKYGYENGHGGTALLGLRLMANQIEIIKRLPIRNIVIATDNDKYGIDAKYKIAESLKGIKTLYDFEYPEGVKDPGDLTQEQFDNIKLRILI